MACRTLGDKSEPVPPPSQPHYLNPLSEWLLSDGWNIVDSGDLLKALAQRMLDQGIDIWRMRLTLRTLHPQVIGVSFTWLRDREDVEIYEAPHAIVQTDQYRNSPFAAIFEGAGGVRRRLDIPGAVLDYGVLVDLKAEGATDYVAMPLVFSDGKINAITFATRRPGGFRSSELGQINELLPVLARLVEVHAMRRTAKTLLDTYLGPHTGDRVLNGHIRRGDGEDIAAVIWFCDLRDSTALAESMPRADFLGILNDYFDCVAGAVVDQGGEVLRFIGDAALAIFPTDGKGVGQRACSSVECAAAAALSAAAEAERRLEGLNDRRTAEGLAPLGFGLALHIGDLTYGNIGVPGRLEFTVVGAAANEAARMEGLSKPLGHRLIVSDEFARAYPASWISLGHHRLAGLAAPREVFTLSDEALAALRVPPAMAAA